MAPDNSEGGLTFEIEASSESPTTIVATTGTHEFVADSSNADETESRGPHPEEYLLGALAGCTNELTYEVADELDMELAALDIVIEGEKGASGDDQAGSSRVGFDNILVDLTVDSDAQWATIDRWLSEVKNRNPVINNLQELTPVNISVYKDGDEQS